MLHEEADDSRGAGRGQLPVRRELGTADRFVVGMAFNSDVIRSEFWLLEPVQQAFQDGLAKFAQVRGSAREEGGAAELKDRYAITL